MAASAASLRPVFMDTPARPILTIVSDEPAAAAPGAYVPEPFPWNVVPRQASMKMSSPATRTA